MSGGERGRDYKRCLTTLSLVWRETTWQCVVGEFWRNGLFVVKFKPNSRF